MDQKNKKSKKINRSKFANKQPRGQAKGVRKEPSQSPLHNFDDIYVGLATKSPNATKSPRTLEDIFTRKASYWNPSPLIRGFTPTGSSSSLPSATVTPMWDYENPIDLSSNRGISPNFANNLLKQIVVHGETLIFPSTSKEGLIVQEEETNDRVDCETVNYYHTRPEAFFNNFLPQRCPFQGKFFRPYKT